MHLLPDALLLRARRVRQVTQRCLIPAGVTTTEEVEALPPELRGDCMRASIASLFDVDYEAVPELRGDGWWQTLDDWLALRGLYCVVRKASDFAPWKGLYLIDGPSARGDWGHMAVGRFSKLDDADEWTWQIVFDPHPSRSGFRKDENGRDIVANVWELHCFDPSLLTPRTP
jgi:hypothetical protein